MVINSVTDPWVYCYRNIGLLNPFNTSFSDSEVERYGENLGSVLTDIAGALIGANAAKITSYLSKTASGQKLLKIINAADKIGNLNIGRLAIKTVKYFDQLDCEKVWLLKPFTRGNKIDDLFNNLGRYFPVVDRLENGVITSVKSVDMSLKTYQNERKLLSTLKGYVNALDNAETYAAVRKLNYSGKELLLAIPDIELADAQINALNSLYAYAAEKNIAVSIAIIK